jgi:hypothetical protein
MRRQEATYREHNPNHQFEFVSLSGSEIAPKFRQRIMTSCDKELQLLGY